MAGQTTCRIKDDRYVDNAELVILTDNGEERLFGVEFKITKFRIPDVDIEDIKVPNPINTNISVYSEKKTVERINVDFKLDVDLSNFWAVHEELNKVKNNFNMKASENDMDLAIILYDNRNVRLYPIIYKRCKILKITGVDMEVGKKTKTKKSSLVFSCTYFMKGK